MVVKVEVRGIDGEADMGAEAGGVGQGSRRPPARRHAPDRVALSVLEVDIVRVGDQDAGPAVAAGVEGGLGVVGRVHRPDLVRGIGVAELQAGLLHKVEHVAGERHRGTIQGRHIQLGRVEGGGRRGPPLRRRRLEPAFGPLPLGGLGLNRCSLCWSRFRRHQSRDWRCSLIRRSNLIAGRRCGVAQRQRQVYAIAALHSHGAIPGRQNELLQAAADQLHEQLLVDEIRAFDRKGHRAGPLGDPLEKDARKASAPRSRRHGVARVVAQRGGVLDSPCAIVGHVDDLRDACRVEQCTTLDLGRERPRCIHHLQDGRVKVHCDLPGPEVRHTVQIDVHRDRLTDAGHGGGWIDEHMGSSLGFRAGGRRGRQERGDEHDQVRYPSSGMCRTVERTHILPPRYGRSQRAQRGVGSATEQPKLFPIITRS